MKIDSSRVRRAGAVAGYDVNTFELQALEVRALLSAYVYHDVLGALGIPAVIAENGAPLPPMGVEYAGYGHGAVALGDLDSDGFGDYAVSAPGGEGIAGAVFVRSGQTGDVLFTFSDGFEGFGVSMANMGDLDGDGVPELAIGSPRFDGNANAAIDPAGRVWVFSLADGSGFREFDGAAAFDEFGAAIARVADLDNDGYADLAVGAPGANSAAGAVSVFSSVGFAVLFATDGEQAGARLGAAVASPPSGTDGMLLAAGAPGYDWNGEDAGRVWVYDRAGSLGYFLDGRAAGDAFGASVSYYRAGASLGLVVGAPGADMVTSVDPVFADRGAALVFESVTAVLRMVIGGPGVVGARFGSVVEAVGDLDGDGNTDVGVTAPGLGTGGETVFFRGRFSANLLAFTPETPDSGTGHIGRGAVAGAPGRGLRAVGDINNDGFPDVLVGDGTGSAQVLASYALVGTLRIDGASDDHRFLWSDRGQTRAFLIADGEIRAYSHVSGLVPSDPSNWDAARSHIWGINNAGTILFQTYPGLAGLDSELHLIVDGVVSTFESMVTSIEGMAPTLLTAVYPRAIGNGGHIVVQTSLGSWILDNGVLSQTGLDVVMDVNVHGTVVGYRSLEGGNEFGTWSRAAGYVRIDGLESVGRINDDGEVVGVLPGMSSHEDPGHLAIWDAGVVTDLGGTADAFPVGQYPAVWEFRGFNTSGVILADVQYDTYQGPRYRLTYVYEPGQGLRRLADATHAFGDVSFGEWSSSGSSFGPALVLAEDGGIFAYSGALEPVDNEAPNVLRSDSPTASISVAGVQYFAGVNQYGELMVFRQSGSGWTASRMSTQLVEPGNTSMVMFADGGAAYLVMAMRGRMDLYSLALTPGSTPFDIRVGRPPEQGAVVEQLTVLTNSDGVVHLAGLDAHGDLVIFYGRPGQSYGIPSPDWNYDNLSRNHLEARMEETPRFAANLTTFATTWGTMHIAGVDDAGHVRVVWWGPDSILWRVTDLTASATDARLMQGNVSAFVTAWGTMHINGTDDQGRVVSLWWAPGFGAEWLVSQLAPDASTRLAPSSLTSYTTPWGGLNVVGRDIATGRAVAYWWAPASGVWSVEILRVTGGVQGPSLAGALATNASAGGTLNVFARDGEGHARRLSWRPGDAGIWSLEDLTVLG